MKHSLHTAKTTKCPIGKNNHEKQLVADSGSVRAAGEIHTIREIICIFKEAWLEGGQQGPLSVSTIQALKEADCWGKMCFNLKLERQERPEVLQQQP